MRKEFSNAFMKNTPQKLLQKIHQRTQENALRSLPQYTHELTFFSNDYLGFSTSATIFQQTQRLLAERNLEYNGATGSRLLSGNHPLYAEAETFIASFHKAQAALIFNSGYDANIGFLSSIPQRGDIILYDEYVHASIREGIRLSHAHAYKFAHNSMESLEEKLTHHQAPGLIVYIVTESVFSMDGDSPDIEKLASLASRYGAFLVIDEAHAVGVFGQKGEGLVQEAGLENEVFARIVTFGKALGCHGAAILGSEILKTYLINFARSFIYTTGLSPHAVATIIAAYQQLEKEPQLRHKLLENIHFFRNTLIQLGLAPLFIESWSAIQSCLVPGNNSVKRIAHELTQKAWAVKPILAPTVPIGKERLRFCLQSNHSFREIQDLLQELVRLQADIKNS